MIFNTLCENEEKSDSLLCFFFKMPLNRATR
nr:MAG TPA: hypothetical protein [Caudoviricetes sp.]